ncbi:MAG: hypothetical protein HKN51_14780 [Saprospiraceae bacterium]|nr:SIR2 family protein [Bacteroidia bacterium]NNE16247.1 hypothetical protein [Saprospiraceae bacterium]
MKKIDKSKLEELANKLVLNQITNSIEDYDNKLIKKITNDDKNKLVKLKKECRYVLLIGAGASHYTTNKIPLARQAYEKIRENIQQGDSLTTKLIDDELYKNSLIYKLNKTDFESQLFAISKYFPQEVEKNLVQLFKKKYEIGLFYEIVGHLLKHRFIDIIINYNFDEILDNVISEEIKNEDFNIIYSDGHCPENYTEGTIHKNNRGLKTPIYIKPHGTSSHSSTMRFTRKDYYNISHQINKFIQTLFIGEHNKDDYKYELNLIIVGFGMKSFELNEIIKNTYEIKNKGKKRKHHTKINSYIFDYLQKDQYLESINDEVIYNKLNPIHFHSPNPDSFDIAFHELWKLIHSKYKEEYKPKGIERHILLSRIFSDKTTFLNSYNTKKQYFKERTYFEITVLYLASDGLLNAVQLRKSRVYKYFKLYKKAKGRKRLSSFLKDMGISKYKGYVADTFIIEDARINQTYNILFKHFYEKLLLNIRNKIVQDKIRKNKKEILKDLFPKIKKNNLLNVNYDNSYMYDVKFERITARNIIRNDTHWAYLFRHIFENKNTWDALYTISEMGRFLFKPEQAEFIGKKQIEIIASSFDIEDQERKINWKPFRNNLISKKPLKLPWWLHNQHLVLFLKKSKSKNENTLKHNLELKYGFYFDSRLLNRDVSPLFIDDQDNLNKMLNIFTSYWDKAKQFSIDKRIKNAESYKSHRKKRNELLKLTKVSLNLSKKQNQ